MQQLFRLICTSAMLMHMINAYALIPTNFPSDLLYQGKPIDPICMSDIETKEGFVSLGKCGINSESNRQITNIDQNLEKSGFIGYEYVWTVDEIESHGFSYYKVLGKKDDNDIIFTLNRSGVSGNVTALYLIKRQGDVLHFKLLANGDRCAHGIISASLKNNILIYQTHITAHDFFTLTNYHALNAKMLTSLPECTSCCIATAKFAIDLNQKALESKLLMVDLTSAAKPLNTKFDNNYQTCFNNLLNRYTVNKMTFLNVRQLENFVDEFNITCETKR